MTVPPSDVQIQSVVDVLTKALREIEVIAHTWEDATHDMKTVRDLARAALAKVSS